MIFFNSSHKTLAKRDELIIECECGTHSVRIISFCDDPDSVYLELWASNFYTKQKENIFKRIGHRLKLIWFAIIGKEYRLEDVEITREETSKVIAYLQQMIDNKKTK